MDFDYVEDYRPSLRLQAGGGSSSGHGEILEPVDRKQAAGCIAAGLLLLWSACMTAGVVQLVVAWVAVSLMLGPFAPSFLTGGDCRVGRGEILPPACVAGDPPPVDAEKKNPRARKQVNPQPYSSRQLESEDGGLKKKMDEAGKHGEGGTPVVVQGNGSNVGKIDGDWTMEEMGMLRKLVVKYPRGTLRRWEVIAESFNGSRSVDNVILMAKALGEKKPGDEDAYSKFLAQRKTSSKQISSDASQRKDIDPQATTEDIAGTGNGLCDGNGNQAWSEAEDKALLSALKESPKDTPMRWEKIAAAVGGSRSKNQCFKRYSELRDGFRNAAKVEEDR